MSTNGVGYEIRRLADRLDRLDRRGKAAVFGLCGRALAPLLTAVQVRNDDRWTFAEVDAALDVIEEFATGSAPTADHFTLRIELLEAACRARELGTPWSTYIQSTVVCVDAGLAAASVGDSPRSMSIQYALDPLIITMGLRDTCVGQRNGRDLQNSSRSRAVPEAIHLLHVAVAEFSRGLPVRPARLASFVERAAVLRPADC